MKGIDLAQLVNRFLVWPLPKTVSSDFCVTEPNYPHARVGTNLLTADEARQMLEYIFAEGLPIECSKESV